MVPSRLVALGDTSSPPFAVRVDWANERSYSLACQHQSCEAGDEGTVACTPSSCRWVSFCFLSFPDQSPPPLPPSQPSQPVVVAFAVPRSSSKSNSNNTNTNRGKLVSPGNASTCCKKQERHPIGFGGPPTVTFAAKSATAHSLLHGGVDGQLRAQSASATAPAASAASQEPVAAVSVSLPAYA